MARYEDTKAYERQTKFINAQLKAEAAIWTKFYRKLLAELTEVIKYHPMRNDERWVSKALPALRTMYKKVRDNSEEGGDTAVARSTLSQMCGIINEYNKGSGVMLLIGSKKDETSAYGVPKSMWLSFKHNSKWYPIREGLSIIGQS